MWHRLFYSFPIQLFILHLRKNLLFVGLWVLMIWIALGNFGKVLGIPYLFLDPEYLNEVSWVGFFMMGVGIAVFTMAFHMTTYIIDGSRFKFLAVVNKPFLHYCLNNLAFPLIFYAIYIIAFIKFQLNNELENEWLVLRFFLGFLVGSLLTYMVLFTYFKFTNKDFFVLFADSLDKRLKKTQIPRANVMQRYKEGQKLEGQVETYLGTDLRIRLARPDLARFDRKKLLRVFDQNHLNLLIIQLVLVGFVILMGIFKDQEWLQLPAALSATLLLAILTMMIGAISFWLRSWTPFFLLALIVVFNAFTKTEFFNRPHTAYGLDYEADPAPYNLERLSQLVQEDTVAKDMENTLRILDNWKNGTGEEKPKMLFITTSGGGQRAALWTLQVLQEAHRATGGNFFQHCKLITGASGGMVGAAFFRELYLRSLFDPLMDLTSPEYQKQLASDNLNPIIFTLLVNDLLIRNQYFEYSGRKYLMDRGGAFENQLNKNTLGILDKPISAYKAPEFEGKIPLMPISPLVINDARKLYISPHSMSYMAISQGRTAGGREKSQGIDFIRFFKEQDAENLRFISALRMGATFPFITPNIQLPSSPVMETMDTGLSDNFGMQDAFRFMHVFREWIAENTSGVVLMTIRDSEKIMDIEHKNTPSILDKLIIPLKNIYTNWDNVQTLNNEILFNYISETMPFSIERVEFEYSTKDFVRERNLLFEGRGESMQQELEIERASLNWRLTAKEKRSILDNIQSIQNQKALERLWEIFGKDQ